MKLYKKEYKDILLEANQNILVFPTSLYQTPPNSTLEKIIRAYPRPYHHLKDAVDRREIDIGNCFCIHLIDKLDISFLLTTFAIDDKLNNELKHRYIDYEMLYLSLENLYTDVVNNGIIKIGFCINDFLRLGCNINILEAMIRQIFCGYFTITFIYGQ